MGSHPGSFAWSGSWIRIDCAFPDRPRNAHVTRNAGGGLLFPHAGPGEGWKPFSGAFLLPGSGRMVPGSGAARVGARHNGPAIEASKEAR